MACRPSFGERLEAGVPPGARVTVIPGTSPLVLVAPHGGRRDPVRRPWSSGRMRVNDLHTAALTAELAARLGAAALINEDVDRNDVDLNRIAETHERAPELLARLAELLEAVIARHGRATLLTIHGWNVVQPAVDLGLGCGAAPDPFHVGHRAAVSPAFADAAVRSLVTECGARGIGATVGARYPARHRENLLQLFTPRYAADERQLVRTLAALAPSVDAVQLELGIALRWPGAWRERLVDACVAARPLLLDPPKRAGPSRSVAALAAHPAPDLTRRLEFTTPELCGLMAVDARGGRLLLFPRAGGLVLFTGERVGDESPGVVGGLETRGTPDGGLAVGFRGPALRFTETTPFLDLETGLAAATLIETAVDLEIRPAHAASGGEGGDFGRIEGVAVLDGQRTAIAGGAFHEEGGAFGPWPRLRAAFQLPDGAGLVLTIALADGSARGHLCRRGAHAAVRTARYQLGASNERIALEVELTDGERVRLDATPRHRLPVIRTAGPTPVRIDFLACGFAGDPSPAGWCEVGGALA
jgi:hypothetical protein